MNEEILKNPRFSEYFSVCLSFELDYDLLLLVNHLFSHKFMTSLATFQMDVKMNRFE